MKRCTKWRGLGLGRRETSLETLAEKPDFFLLRTALNDRPQGPPTASHQPPTPPTTNRQPPIATNRRQPPTFEVEKVP